MTTGGRVAREAAAGVALSLPGRDERAAAVIWHVKRFFLETGHSRIYIISMVLTKVANKTKIYVHITQIYIYTNMIRIYIHTYVHAYTQTIQHMDLLNINQYLYQQEAKESEPSSPRVY